jgi:hypothetical protein
MTIAASMWMSISRSGGMSLRDYFAAKAMARYVYSDGTNDPALAARAYQIADAMIAERNRVK